MAGRPDGNDVAVPVGSVDGGLIEGEAVDVLRERSETLDLMVMGSHVYGPERRTLLGSVSPGLLVDCLCPVLVLPRGTARPVAEPLAYVDVSGP